MRQLRLCLLLLLLVALPACRHATTPAVSISPSAASPAAIASPSPVPPVASDTATPVIVTPTTFPLPSPNPTTQERTDTPGETPAPQPSAPITPQNASELTPISHLEFSPWDQILAIRWSPDGSMLAAAAGDSIYLLDSTTLQEKRKLTPGVATPGLGFSPDGRFLAAGGRDGALHIWQVGSGLTVHEFQAHQKSISSLSYSPDGALLATAGYDAIARLWDVGDLQNLGEMIGGSYAIPAIAFTPDSANLAIVNSNVIRLREVATQRMVISLVANESIYSIAISPDGKYLASGDVNNGVRIWDLAAPPGPGGEIRASLLELSGHTGRANRPEALVWQVCYAPNGSLLASAGGDATLRLWAADDGELLATLPGHTKAVTSLAFSPDGKYLASGGLDGRLILWAIGISQVED